MINARPPVDMVIRACMQGPETPGTGGNYFV